MDLMEQLRQHTDKISASDRRTYLTLIKSNPTTADALQRLALVALKLGKGADEIHRNQVVLVRVAELKGKIVTAQDSSPDLERVSSSLRAYREKTKELNAQRAAGEEPFCVEHQRLQQIRNEGEDAIGELNKLLGEYPDILADERAANANDLK